MQINEYKIDYSPFSLPLKEPVRIIANQDGEKLTSLDVFYGYTHKGIEKILANSKYRDICFYFEKLDGYNRASDLYTYVALIEKILNINVSLKTEFMRLIILELARIFDHLKSLREIALLLDIEDMRKVTTTIINKIAAIISTEDEPPIFLGGINLKFKDNFIPYVSLFLKKDLRPAIKHIHSVFKNNRLFRRRLEGLGVITKEDAVYYGISGINLRAAGIEYDTRVQNPYGIYDMFKIFIPSSRNGDAFSRYRLRLEEIFSSTLLIDNAIGKMPLNDDISQTDKPTTEDLSILNEDFSVPKGYYHFATETPKGEFHIHLFADDKDKPEKIKITSPSMNSLLLLEKICLNHFVSDIPIILNSLDLSFKEIDR